MPRKTSIKHISCLKVLKLLGREGLTSVYTKAHILGKSINWI